MSYIGSYTLYSFFNCMQELGAFLAYHNVNAAPQDSFETLTVTRVGEHCILYYQTGQERWDGTMQL